MSNLIDDGPSVPRQADPLPARPAKPIPSDPVAPDAVVGRFASKFVAHATGPGSVDTAKASVPGPVDIKRVTFPPLPNPVQVRPGATVEFNISADKLASRLKPSEPAHLNSAGMPPALEATLQYKVDGGEVKSLEIAGLENALGHYSTFFRERVVLPIPSGARHVEYWFKGSTQGYSNTYFSNNYKNFSINVIPAGYTPLTSAPNMGGWPLRSAIAQLPVDGLGPAGIWHDRKANTGFGIDPDTQKAIPTDVTQICLDAQQLNVERIRRVVVTFTGAKGKAEIEMPYDPRHTTTTPDSRDDRPMPSERLEYRVWLDSGELRSLAGKGAALPYTIRVETTDGKSIDLKSPNMKLTDLP